MNNLARLLNKTIIMSENCNSFTDIMLWFVTVI